MLRIKQRCPPRPWKGCGVYWCRRFFWTLFWLGSSASLKTLTFSSSFVTNTLTFILLSTPFDTKDMSYFSFWRTQTSGPFKVVESHYLGELPFDTFEQRQHQVDRERLTVMILQPFPEQLQLEGNLESTFDVSSMWSSYQERLCRGRAVNKLVLQAERHQTRATRWLQAKPHNSVRAQLC